MLRNSEGCWHVFKTEDLVTISRPIAIGDRSATEFIEERHALDSERPMGMEEVYVLATVTIYPWEDSPEHIDEVVAHARRFLKAHEPVTAGR